MWDKAIWEGRFSSYRMTELVDLIEEKGATDPLSLLADQEIARRVAAKRLEGSERPAP